MKSIFTKIVIALLFSVTVHSQAQTSKENNSVWDGIQSSLGNLFADTELPLEIQEAIRLTMIRNGDIVMWMSAKSDGDSQILIPPIFDGNMPLFYYETAYQSKIYGEFDWDNKALMMKGSSTANESGFALAGGYSDVPIGKWKNKESSDLQYTDKEGYWYVPYDDPNYQGTGENDQMFVKFNAKNFATGALQELLDLSNRISVEKLHIVIHYIFNNLNWEMLNPQLDEEWTDNMIDLLMSQYMESNGELTENIRNTLSELLNENNTDRVGFPIFIHWAFLYTPDVIKAKFNVKEKKFACYDGLADHKCTKLTVTSGKEKDKFMIFDKYNRLVYIDSGKDGSVEYLYDQDLTVELPPAYKLGDIINAYSED